jgi:hypothetical protein
VPPFWVQSEATEHSPKPGQAPEIESARSVGAASVCARDAFERPRAEKLEPRRTRRTRSEQEQQKSKGFSPAARILFRFPPCSPCSPWFRLRS